ncbi:UDP-2,4-diacetamido-2,4,6-trideoxy-beta-L-altropyranose hydrolase [Clostridium sp. UBA1652]|uniref:UDP-2,4-diacetamido-2,4, 6-trideoxy-beta-L-altropyranose hydrolase n=1 Tax=Clostridium sp. UBA1652 TaxID=1946348 RepID=UPI00257ABF8B|nr:UDP-2,4-diacetamido-2,4,6-trideoxy-beta-L-altropyranose hydrolase [Clostridium sp. UBA1652]
MKALIRADGGFNVGMGHIIRCMALYDELIKNNVECIFVSKKDNVVEGYFKDKKVRYILMEAMELDGEKIEIKNIIKNYNTDVIITDSYNMNEEYLLFLKSLSRYLVSIDDNYLFDYPSDIVVNPNVYAERKKYNKKTSKYLLGGQYCILRDEFRESSHKNIKVKAENILITMGGTDVNNVTPFIIKAIKKIHGININVIVGKGFENRELIEKSCKNGQNIKLIYNPKDMRILMENADVCISSSGSTLYELASLGVPTLFVIQADNQLRLAEYMEKNQIMINLGWYYNLKEKALLDEITNIIDNQGIRLKLSADSKKIINVDGVKNIVQKIIQYFL